MRHRSVRSHLLTGSEVPAAPPAPRLGFACASARRTRADTRAPGGPHACARACGHAEKLWDRNAGSTHHFVPPSSEWLD